MIHNLYKQRGETPLECIQRFVEANPDLKNDPSNPLRMNKFTYLGRLDPLAEGVLLVASGEDVHRKEEFLGLDKEYDFVSIFGFATDTFDVLGKILRVERVLKMNELDLIKLVKVFEGEREQKYPFYSSKNISTRLKHSSQKRFSSESPRLPDVPSRRAGVSSLRSARLSSENFSSKNVFPSPDQGEGRVGFFKKITIHKMEFLGLDTLSHKELFGRLLMDISKVKGDFRQHEILVLWKQILFGSGFPSLDQGEGRVGFLGKFSAHVSSGTYIRGLVNDMGNSLGLGATTLSIKRTRVGSYKIKDSLL